MNTGKAEANVPTTVTPVSSPTKLPGVSAVPARQPLTFHDSGVYGGWNEYWLSDECPYNFFIVQAVVREDGQLTSHGQVKGMTWEKWLLQARAKGKRIIADVMPDGWAEAKDPLAQFKKGLDGFMNAVDESQLYAITLGEENIYWDGHDKILQEMYAYAKQKYDVPVYQSYSPYAHPPGFGWPHLPADGWMIDEYAHGGASFEEFVRSYAVHQLPIVQIVWAAPVMRDFDWVKAGEPAFDWQINVGRKYNIPTSYFAWEGRANTWGWSPEALPITKSVFERAKEWSRRAARTDLTSYVNLWDDIPSLKPQPFTYLPDKTATFKEDFLTGGGLVSKGAVVQGFRDVRWDGGPLELRPRKSGAASAVLQYPLRSDFPLSDLKVQVTGRTTASTKGSLTVAVSNDGMKWSQAQPIPASGELLLSLNNDTRFLQCNGVWVRVEMKGTAQKTGDILASIDGIQVTGRFQQPPTREIKLESAPSKPLLWDADMNGSLTYTAHIENAANLISERGFLGTHGTEGYTNTAILRQKFVCVDGLDLDKIISKNTADQANYGATNGLGISLDGETVLVENKTSGSVTNAELALDLSADTRFDDVKEFWIHLTMTNASGVKTGLTNRITSLHIEATGTKVVTPK